MRRRRQEAIQGYAFVLPALVLFVFVILVPLVATLVLSFGNFSILGNSKWVGFANYVQFFTDPRLLLIYGNTLKFVAILVPLHLVIGLFLALGVFNLFNHQARAVYRTLIYFPVLVTAASVAVAWQYMFNTTFGLFNWFLTISGLKPVPWLNSPFWVYVAVAIFSVWKFVGNSFIYYLIGLQSIPKDVNEAATLDGANANQRFFRITLPMLSPTVFFVLVTLMIQATQIFVEPYFITGGGPGDASRTVALYIYETAFEFQKLSYGSTLAVSLFAIILVATLLQFSLQRRWVHYGTE